MGSVASVLERYALLILLGLSVCFFALNSQTPLFFTVPNLQNVLINQALLLLLAVATTLPLIGGQIDLSVGPSAGLTALLCAGMMSRHGLPLWVAVLVALGAGAAIGLVNAVLIARVGISSIVATLGMSSVIGAMIYLYSGGLSIITDIAPSITDFGRGRLLGLPLPVYVVAGVCLAGWYVLGHTAKGRNLYAVGASPSASSLVGLSVPRYIGGSLVVAGTLAGLGGVLLVAVQGGGNPQLGPGFTLPAVAAAFLGGTAFQRGRYNVLGTVTAVFFIGVTVNGLMLWGAEGWVSDLVNGVSLLVAVGLTVYAGKRRSRRPAAGSVRRDAGPPAPSGSTEAAERIDAPGELVASRDTTRDG